MPPADQAPRRARWTCRPRWTRRRATRDGVEAGADRAPSRAGGGSGRGDGTAGRPDRRPGGADGPPSGRAERRRGPARPAGSRPYGVGPGRGRAAAGAARRRRGPSGPTRCWRWRPPNDSSPWPKTSRSTTSRTPRFATPPRTRWLMRRTAEVGGPLALRTAEERARAIAGRAEVAAPPGVVGAPGPGPGRGGPGGPGSGVPASPGSWLAAGERGVRGRSPSRWRAAAVERDAGRPPSAPSGNAPWPRCAPSRGGGSPRCWRSSSTPCTATRCCARSRGAGWRRSPPRCSTTTGLAADDLADEYGPRVPVPASAAEMAEYEACPRTRGGRRGAPADALRPRHAAAPRRPRGEGPRGSSGG